MDEKEKAARLKILGEAMRLSELSDKELVVWAVVDMLQGIARTGMQVNHIDLAEMVSYSLCNLGGFHRLQSCKW